MEVNVVNPRRARKFAESLGERSKTDPVDAHVLCEYAARMPWESWKPPSSTALRLRAITRAIESLGVMHTQENNRAHALGGSRALPALVLRERQRHQRYLENRMKHLRGEARRLIARDAGLDRRKQTLSGSLPTAALLDEFCHLVELCHREGYVVCPDEEAYQVIKDRALRTTRSP